MSPTTDIPGFTEKPMSRLARFFPTQGPIRLTMLPVRHEQECITSVGTVWGGGAHGVFLTNDGIGHQRLLRIARTVATAMPAFFVGVHCRDLRPQDLLCRVPAEIRGVWAAIDHLADDLVTLRAARKAADWDGLVVGVLDKPAAAALSLPRWAAEAVDCIAVRGDDSLKPGGVGLDKVHAALRHGPVALPVGVVQPARTAPPAQPAEPPAWGPAITPEPHLIITESTHHTGDGPAGRTTQPR